MEPVLIVIAIIMGISALLCFVVVVHQHIGKGMVFTNAWIYATKAERAQMDPRKKMLERRLARNVFFMLGIIHIVLAIYVIFLLTFLLYILAVLTVILCIYAIVRTVKNVRVYNVLGIK